MGHHAKALLTSCRCHHCKLPCIKSIRMVKVRSYHIDHKDMNQHGMEAPHRWRHHAAAAITTACSIRDPACHCCLVVTQYNSEWHMTNQSMDSPCSPRGSCSAPCSTSVTFLLLWRAYIVHASLLASADGSETAYIETCVWL